MLDTLAVCDQRSGHALGASEKGFDDRRLADPGVAHDECEATSAGAGLRVQPLEHVQLSLATGGLRSRWRERREADRPLGVSARRLLYESPSSDESCCRISRSRSFSRGWRVNAELVLEHPAERLKGVERLSVSAAAVKSQHELASEALAERVAADERFELGDELRVASEDKLRIDALLEAGQALLAEARLLQPCERLFEFGEGCTAPELQCSPQRRGSLADPAGCKRLAPGGMEPSNSSRSSEWPARSRT